MANKWKIGSFTVTVRDCEPAAIPAGKMNRKKARVASFKTFQEPA